MAFKVDGMQGLIEFFGDMSTIPDDIADEMLKAGAEVTKTKMVNAVRSKFPDGTGQMADSITVGKPKNDHSTIDIYFKGTRKPITAKSDSGNDTQKRYKRKAGDIVAVRNAEVAFINEYGAPRKNIAATNFIEKAVNEAADPAIDAVVKIYDKHLNKINL